MSESSKKSSFSFTKLFVFLLTFAFVLLKATGHLNWSWWEVFSPVLIYVGIKAVIVICTVIFAFAYVLRKQKETDVKLSEWRKRLKKAQEGNKQCNS